MTLAQERVPQRAPRGLSALGHGLGAPFRGFAYVASRPALWRYGLLPILLNLIISTGLLVGTWYLFKSTASRIHEYFSGFFGRLLEAASLVLVGFAAIALAVVAWYLLQGVLCDFFYVRLARRVELQMGTRPEELRDVSFLAGLVDTLMALTALVFVNLGLLALNCVPVVGTMLAAPLSFLFTCWVFGSDYMSYPLLLRGWRRGRRREFTWGHPGQVLGMGIVVLACNLVPILNAILLTGAAAGSVLLHREVTGQPVAGTGQTC